MTPITIYTYQQTTITSSSYFTWGEGMKETEHTEYGPLDVYIDDLSIPPRLIADLQYILKKNIHESSFHFCVKKFTNNNLVSISCLPQNAQTEHLININSLTPMFNGVSIYRFTEFRVFGVYNKFPIQRANFKESALLSSLGLDFEEEYLFYVKKNFFNEDIRHLLRVMLDEIISQNCRNAIEGLSKFDSDIVKKKLYNVCIDSKNEYEYLTKESVEFSIKRYLYDCKYIFLKEKIESLLLENKYYNKKCFNNYLLSVFSVDDIIAEEKIQAYYNEYMNKWLEYNNYVNKVKSYLREGFVFKDIREYEKVLRQYLTESPYNFDSEIIYIIVARTFEHFIPVEHIKTEVPKAELKILGKIDLDKIKRK